MSGRAPHPVLDDGRVERILTRGAGSGDDDLRYAVDLVHSLAEGPAPRPSAALAALLDRGVEPVVMPLRRPAAALAARRWATRGGAVVTAAAASLLVAGTAAALPPAVQDGLADLVSVLTPFELPRPGEPSSPSTGVPAEDGAEPGSAPPELPLPLPSPEAVPAGPPTAESAGAAGDAHREVPVPAQNRPRTAGEAARAETSAPASGGGAAGSATADVPQDAGSSPPDPEGTAQTPAPGAVTRPDGAGRP